MKSFPDEIFQCPRTGRPLVERGDRLVVAGETDGYRIRDGIALMTPDAQSASTAANIVDWYDSFGWTANETGSFKEAVAGLGQVQRAHNRQCLERIGRYFAPGGRFLLDIGSGALAHDELLAYSRNFERRICVDLSITGLRQAQQRLGERGIYVQGDATRLPFADDAADAITCNHLIYQLPAGLQRQALLEIWRVLKPGGVAVVVYLWSYSPIALRLRQMASKLGFGRREPEEGRSEPIPPRDPDEPQTRRWFEDQAWPFDYSYDCYRLVDQYFMRRFVSDDWRGRVFLDALFALQRAAPSICGRYGLFPAIVLRKPAG